MRSGILCSGNWVVDLIKIIDRWPQEGMLANILSETMNGGGGPHNVLVNLAKMDPDLPLFASGLVSNDKFGKFLELELDKFGINRSYLFKTSEESTSFTDVMTNKSNGNRTFFHKRGTNALLNLEYFNEVDCNAKIFYLGYPMLLDSLDSNDSQYGTKAARLLSSMRKKGLINAVDLVSIENENYKEIIQPILRFTDYLIINEIEAEKCSGIPTRGDGKLLKQNLSKASNALLNSGVNKMVAIHAPEGGFAESIEGEKLFVNSKNILDDEIKGSVGAGDAFCAGMLYGLHQEFDLKKCLEIANTNAWFNLQNETSTGGAVSANKIFEKIK